MSVSTHVLDAVLGGPAAGVAVTLSAADGSPVAAAHTDSDGRVTALTGDLDPGIYRLAFGIDAYRPDGFYPEVVITFRVREPSAHHHVPLLLSPFAYSTYRGS